MTPTNLFPFFDPSRPVFVKIDTQLSGEFRKKGELFDWQKLGVPYWMMKFLFDTDQVHHNPELEAQLQQQTEVTPVVVGDGLDNLTLNELHIVVEKINEKVKAKTKTAKEFSDKKCAYIPKDRGAQIRRIRNWRLTYGELEK